MTVVDRGANDLVAVTCQAPGSHCVVLRGPGLPTVKLCHFPNPARARETAEAVRAFLHDLLRPCAAGAAGVSESDARTCASRA